MGVFLFLLAWWVTKSPSGSLLAATLLIYVQLVVVMAVTILFSTVASPILASVLGVCVFFAGQLSHNVLSLTRPAMRPSSGRLPCRLLRHPNLNAVDIKGAVVGEGTAQWTTITLWTAYLAGYTVLALLLASWIFSRKEF
jgi:ABC-type transport system involved in multi-copper enzyme maturation permease subunit